MMKNILETECITKEFRGHPAVRGVSLQVTECSCDNNNFRILVATQKLYPSMNPGRKQRRNLSSYNTGAQYNNIVHIPLFS